MKQRFSEYTGAWRRWAKTMLPIIVILIGLALVLIPASFRLREGARSHAPLQAENTAQAAEKNVFESPLAGRWYEADKDKLAAEIDSYLGKVDAPAVEDVHAIIVPHAGYQYSGQVAAYSYKQIAGKKFSRVIVMGPSHRLPMENVASVPDATDYSTPLGSVPIDTDFVAALRKYPEFRHIRGADEEEHSVQIQLPFLQRVLGEFKFVPIVVGQVDLNTAKTMAQILGGLIDPQTLVVASSDFTHYGPNYGYVPFGNDVQANLEKLDSGSWEFIEKKDLDGFFGYVEKTGTTICGRCPIGILLAMLPPEAVAHRVKYDTSGRITGDTTNSVSYFAITFSGAWTPGRPMEAKPQTAAQLTEEDKAQLLTLARATLEGYVRKGRAPAPEELGIKITAGMSEMMGAFVTLKEHGDLRGCIGEIFPQRALYKAVIDHAIDAGVHDPRFQQVTADELPLLHYEISALTQPYPVASYNDIVLGKHGIVIEKKGYTAVFLPQVPGEQGWDLPTTLSHLSRKAGLSPDAWKEGASFTVFEAIVFGEKEK